MAPNKMSDIVPENPISSLKQAMSSLTTSSFTEEQDQNIYDHQQQQPPPSYSTTAVNFGDTAAATNSNTNTTNKADYYAKGSAELATENALTLAKIQHRLRLTKRSERLVLVLVGLPGRGKSFIARKLQNFVTWRGSECKVFNVGKYRRKVAAGDDGEEKGGDCGADFFDSGNAAAAQMRQMAAQLALDDMLYWLDHGDGGGRGGGKQPQQQQQQQRKDRVAIFDATNSTKARRDWVLQECTSNSTKRTGVVFVESICDDKDLLDANFLTKVQTSPDYKDMDQQTAMADLRSRVKKYEEAYETIEDDTLSYIKIFNLSSKMLVNHIYGRMAKSIVPALMAWNIGTRPVFICRAGQTMNEQERAVNNTHMSRSENLGRHGKAFRDSLFGFMREECLDFMKRRQDATFRPDLNTGTSMSGVMNQSMGRSFSFDGLAELDKMSQETPVHPPTQDEYQVGTDGVTPLPFPCHIMSSTMPRARQTVDWENIPYPVEMMSNLNPLDKGDFTGQELEDIALTHPDWYNELVADPFYTRFPGGECYGDLTSRLESIVVDVEQQVGPVLVVSHVSVLQVLVAYFRNTPVEDCTGIALPLNTVLKFTPAKGGGWQESQHRILTSPSTSECDLQSYDCLSVSPYSTPMIRTPVTSQMFPANAGSSKGESSPPEVISPLGDHPPIWGDHLYSRRSSREMKRELSSSANKEKFALPQLSHMK
mmetsp:Transcript_28988/g.49396  ORF Transcript_28988/g.49396 Transcript_28988/m.49396 type:complete len:709 (-) Transcript_28988:88-2214(-)